MKQIYSFSLVALLLFSFSAQAQITLIPKAGMSLSNYVVTKRGDHTTSRGIGLTAGMGCNIANTKVPWLSFQPELNYIQKTFTFRQTSIDSQIGLTFYSQTTRRNHYLEIPLLGRASFGKQSIKGFVIAGPSLGYFLDGGGKSKLTINGQPVEITPEMFTPAIGKTYHSVEIGLQVGGGISIPMGPGTFLFEARYGLGLTNFVKKHQILLSTWGIEGEPEMKIPVSFPADEKSRTFIFTCGYAVPLGK